MNKLAEYLTAHPVRRRQIIEDQKRPDVFRVARYRGAREAIVRQLARNPTGVDELHLGITAQQTRLHETNWQEQDADLSIEALQAFADLEHGLEVELAPVGTCPKLTFAGVEVSVQPDLVALGKDRKGRPFTGAVKLHFSKRNGLDEEAGAYGAALLHHWASLHLASEALPLSRKHCVLIDVLGGRVAAAPKASVRRLNTIEVACEEIALRWGSV